MKLNNQQKISPELANILITRISLSRETKIFSLEELARGWTVSSRTLFRYINPKDREYSRLAAKRVTEAYRAIDKELCQICGNKLKGHDRCKTCTMLIHDVPECSCENSCVVVLDPYKLLIQLNKHI